MIQLKKIISGGQTGADLGALIAAKKLNLETGGWAPRFFRTENGSNIELGTKYRLQEHKSREYPPRTKQNIQESDGTLIFGNLNSPGCSLTRAFCLELNRPLFLISYKNNILTFYNGSLIGFLGFYKIQILNCSGNRESKNPGIQIAIEQFLTQTLKDQTSWTTREI